MSRLLVAAVVAAVVAGACGGDRGPLRVTVIGVDGATWRVMDPLLADGALPRVQALVDGGVRGPLRSQMPLISPPVWTTIATSESDMACCIAVGDNIYAGTDDAEVLRVNAEEVVERLGGFDAVAGRDTWYAGSAVIDGQRVGPPLGVRSMTATPDGTVLLVNVHVGGIPRSTDGGVTWQPTIAIESDVHEVRAHPKHPGVVMAAAAVGLCTSRDQQ